MRSIRNAIVPASLITMTAILLILAVPSLISSQTPPPHIIDSQTRPEKVPGPKLASDQVLSLKADFQDCFDDEHLRYLEICHDTSCEMDNLNLTRFEVKNHSIVGHRLSASDCVDHRQPKVEHPTKIERVGGV